MTAPRIVGVLGGMGPEATILFQSRLLKQVPGQDDADHIPLLIDMNPQVPSRIAYLIENRGEDPGPVLARMALRLQTAGAQALVMPCNTAHYFAHAITSVADIPFLNIVDLATDRAAQALGRGGRVGLLASPAVQITGLYDAALEQRGLTAVWPADVDPLLDAIRTIKAGGDLDAARATLARVSAELREAGADMQFIACSEFSIIADCLPREAKAVDTIDLLAERTAAFSLSE